MEMVPIITIWIRSGDSYWNNWRLDFQLKEVKGMFILPTASVRSAR